MLGRRAKRTNWASAASHTNHSAPAWDRINTRLNTPSHGPFSSFPSSLPVVAVPSSSRASMITTTQLREDVPFLIPSITDSVFSKQGGAKDMKWFVAGALQRAKRALTAQEIWDSINEHQKWRIDECRGPNAAKNNIRWILTRSPAFEHDGSSHWYMTGRPLVRTRNMSPTPPEDSIPATTGAGHLIYPAWTDQSFTSFHGAENGRSDSESTFVSRRGSRPTDSTQFDGHWLMTGSALAHSPNMLPPPHEKSTPVMTDAGHAEYPAWTDQTFPSFKGTENDRRDSESTFVSRRGSRPTESTQFDGHWLTTGSALVQSPRMLPTPLEKSTPVITDASHVVYPAWTDQTFPSFNGAGNGRRDSESTFVSRRGSRPTESTQFDGHWLTTGSALVQSPKMLPPPLEKSTPVMTDASHVVYPAWTEQSFAPGNGIEHGRGHSEATESTQFDGTTETSGSLSNTWEDSMSNGSLSWSIFELLGRDPVHYPEEA